MKKLLLLCVGVCLLAPATSAQTTRVPAKGRAIDADGNGYPDVGVVVNGHYESLYAYDYNGDWYWNIGDGRIFGTVTDVALLDEATLTRCEYVNNYRGTFENTPFQDSGWMEETIRCEGMDRAVWHDLIVHRTDPRYTGNPEWAIWGDWEFHVTSSSGWGNFVRRRFPG